VHNCVTWCESEARILSHQNCRRNATIVVLVTVVLVYDRDSAAYNCCGWQLAVNSRNVQMAVLTTGPINGYNGYNGPISPLVNVNVLGYGNKDSSLATSCWGSHDPVAARILQDILHSLYVGKARTHQWFAAAVPKIIRKTLCRQRKPLSTLSSSEAYSSTQKTTFVKCLST